MTKLTGALLCLAAALLFLAAAPAQKPAELVAGVLNDWHRAAAAADEPRYFGHFAGNGVFLGTDATERWTVKEFREWARPHFSAKKAWNFRPRDRHIEVSGDGRTAWFDEMLDTGTLGVCRGSGVLVLEGGNWKIAQYNLSIPIPNALADAIVKEIAGKGK
jgi:hypothetical protein